MTPLQTYFPLALVFGLALALGLLLVGLVALLKRRRRR